MRVACALLLLALAGQAFAQKDACLLVLKVVSKQSQYKIGGVVTKPIKGRVPETDITAGGNFYLRLPAGTPCPPPAPAAADLPKLIAASRLAAPPGRPGVSFTPAVIKSSIPNPANNRTIADWTLSGTSFGMHSNTPIGPGADAAAGAAGCVQTILINGTLKMDSFVGPRTANVATLSENRTMSVVYAAKGPAITVTVKNANFGFDISPEKTPGVALSAAVFTGKGNVVGAADLASKASYVAVPEASIDWNAKPRLWQPTVLGGDDPNPTPAVVPPEGAPGQCQVPVSAAAAAGATKGAAAGAPAAAAAAEAPKSGAAGHGAGAALAAAAAAAAALLVL